MIISAESEYLSGTLLMNKKIKVFTIINAGENVTFEDRETKEDVTKLQFNVRLADTAGTEKKWRPNQKSKQSLIKLFGEDTEKYVNKKVKVMLVPFEDKYSIQIDEIETEDLNKSGKGSTLL